AAELAGGPRGESIAHAARLAFSAAHSTVLLTASLLVALLAAWVFHGLRHQQPKGMTGRSGTKAPHEQ
ncbi:hypothetical protein, partial [Desulfovibrio sp. 1214_IL3152]|uniref:hypothetical protein n=1 Tax=Desulfovibrio sp. 1214_IL3152 TaxID=3084056 RepID=UPI002FD98D6A